MSIITKIDGIPLFSTQQEASQWAILHGLSGYHTHAYNKRIGYMGGVDHSRAMSTPTLESINQPLVTRSIPQPKITQRGNFTAIARRVPTQVEIPEQNIDSNTFSRTLTRGERDGLIVVQPSATPPPLPTTSSASSAAYTSGGSGGGGGGY